MSRQVKFPVIDSGRAFEASTKLHKAQPLFRDIANMDAQTLNFCPGGRKWKYPPRTVYGIICGIRRHLIK